MFDLDQLEVLRDIKKLLEKLVDRIPDTRTINERRAEEGLGPAPWGNQPLTPAGQTNWTPSRKREWDE